MEVKFDLNHRRLDKKEYNSKINKICNNLISHMSARWNIYIGRSWRPFERYKEHFAYKNDGLYKYKKRLHLLIVFDKSFNDDDIKNTETGTINKFRKRYGCHILNDINADGHNGGAPENNYNYMYLILFYADNDQNLEVLNNFNELEKVSVDIYIYR